MDDEKKITGITLLVNRFKKKFRIPENLNHYSEEDYQAAERKFVRFCLDNGDDQENR